jgi:signal transduction histidine kinase
VIARRTVRLRLTLLYTALFLTAGAAMLAITYVLVAQSLPAASKAGPRTTPQVDPSQVVREACQSSVAEDVKRCKAAFAKGVDAGVTSQRGDTLHKLLFVSLLALAAMTLVSAGLGWLLAGRVLRPLDAITAAARRASEDNLDDRIALTGPDDELKRLADTFDAMLARLGGAFAAQRRFVANASHELRTPLTLMRAAIDVTLAKPDRTPEQLEAMAVEVRGAVDRSEELIDALLTLARSDRGAAAREPVDLAAIAEDALELSRARPDVSVEAVLADAPASGDRLLLERLAGNLIQNALAYNVPGGWVRVTTGTRSATAFLEVVNSGPPIADDEVASLFEPFRRLNGRAGSAAGFGLGLSIVRAVATAHGARLDARAGPEGGLAMAIELPRGQEPERSRALSTLPAPDLGNGSARSSTERGTL